MAVNKHSAGDTVLVSVHVTATVERDYLRRNVFPEIRLGNAKRRCNTTGVHRVSVDLATAMLNDAEQQRRDRSLPRGTPTSFGYLARAIREDIQMVERRGLWEDPGYDEAALRMEQSPALLSVGDAAMLDDGTVVRGGRLFAGSILDCGMLAGLRGAGVRLREMSREARRSIACQTLADVPQDDAEAHANRVILTAISELDAHEIIDRIRRKGLGAPRRRSKS